MKLATVRQQCPVCRIRLADASVSRCPQCDSDLDVHRQLDQLEEQVTQQLSHQNSKPSDAESIDTSNQAADQKEQSERRTKAQKKARMEQKVPEQKVLTETATADSIEPVAPLSGIAVKPTDKMPFYMGFVIALLGLAFVLAFLFFMFEYQQAKALQHFDQAVGRVLSQPNTHDAANAEVTPVLPVASESPVSSVAPTPTPTSASTTALDESKTAVELQLVSKALDLLDDERKGREALLQEISTLREENAKLRQRVEQLSSSHQSLSL